MKITTIKFGLILFMIIALVGSPAWSQNHNPPYPRIGLQNFGSSSPEWFAKWDLVVTAALNPSIANNIKAINPNTKVITSTDWNVAMEDAGTGTIKSPFPEQWYAKDSKGRVIKIYWGTVPLANLSNHCPVVDGKKVNEQIADYLATSIDFTAYDGIMSQGLWSAPWAITDIDLNNNGVNDYDEWGSSGVNSSWLNGVKTLISNIRNRLGPDPIVIINSGQFHDFSWGVTNGIDIENSWGIAAGPDYFMTKYLDWMRNAMEPHYFMVNGTAKFDGESSSPVHPSKNYYSLMRYFLTLTLMGDGYYWFEDDECGEHYYSSYYDEFDVNLGYPTSSAYKIMVEGPSYQELMVWVRFFDNGMVINNSKGYPIDISATDLSGLAEWDGPYYHFKGGQDPVHNDGSEFTTVHLDGNVLGNNGAKIRGDGILLLKNPETVVSEIVVDNCLAGTSPGSSIAEFTGTWQQECNRSVKAYQVGCTEWMGVYGYAKTAPTAPAATVTFNPTIKVSGDYEVFEWHGKLVEGNSTKVKYNLTHANGTDEIVVNQNLKSGQWNSLGTYTLTRRLTDDIVVVTTEGSNGYVVGDAIKFEYVPPTVNDVIAPNTPTTLQVLESKEHSIEFGWTEPTVASDGDVASLYHVYRDDVLIGKTPTPYFLDENLGEERAYEYKIIATDDAGNTSGELVGTFETIGDEIAPTIIELYTIGSAKLQFEFSEPVDSLSAINPNNYIIDNGISVVSASLPAPNKVDLITTEHSAGTQYTITLNNIVDRSNNRNPIPANDNTRTYWLNAAPLTISISADDAYELYFNGTQLGSGNTWNTAQTFTAEPIWGKNVIAVKGIDTDGIGAIVAEASVGGLKIVTDESWRCSTVEATDWTTVDFDDKSWSRCTSYGLHGVAEPWHTYNDVNGISTNQGVKWIWSSNNLDDNAVYFRFVFNPLDTEPPQTPQGLSLTSP